MKTEESEEKPNRTNLKKNRPNPKKNQTDPILRKNRPNPVKTEKPDQTIRRYVTYENEIQFLEKKLTTPEPFLILLKTEKRSSIEKREICTFS